MKAKKFWQGSFTRLDTSAVEARRPDSGYDVVIPFDRGIPVVQRKAEDLPANMGSAQTLTQVYLIPHHGGKAKKSTHPRCAPVQYASACPAVIGAKDGDSTASAGAEGGGDGGDGGGGGGDDGGGGEDGDSGDGEPPTRRLWHICKSLLVWLLLAISWPYRALPDLVTLMRLFDDVFPPEIHDKIYAPNKSRLLREICCARDAEWDQSFGRRAWRWVWRRVRFWCFVLTCFRVWAAGLLPGRKRQTGG